MRRDRPESWRENRSARFRAYRVLHHQRRADCRFDRQFRGFCSLKTSYPAVLELFKARKDAIYALYADEIGRLMSPRAVKSTLGYFDDFYRDIATPKDFEKRVLGDCVGDR